VTATSAAHSRHLICTHPTADAQSDTTPAVNRHGSYGRPADLGHDTFGTPHHR